MNRRNGAGAETESAVRWHRSSTCYDGNCVEVAVRGDAVLVRDSKRPDGHQLSVSFHDWAVFMKFVRDTCRGDSFEMMTASAGLVVRDSHRVGLVGRLGSVNCKER
jgi:Domain of unknown function (DUF397)